MYLLLCCSLHKDEKRFSFAKWWLNATLIFTTLGRVVTGCGQLVSYMNRKNERLWAVHGLVIVKAARFHLAASGSLAGMRAR